MSERVARPANFAPDEGETRELGLGPEARGRLWARVIEEVERCFREVEAHRVAPRLDLAEVRRWIERFGLASGAAETPLDPVAAIDLVAEGLWRHQVHTAHARYFGLFNPAPSAMGVAADALVAAFNPQLAAWSHNPAAAEIERHVVRLLAERFGYPPAEGDGTFCSGGAEANHTGLLCALGDRLPAFLDGGLRALDGAPVLYVSELSHHSFAKAARFCGLGEDGVVRVPVDRRLVPDLDWLERRVESDRAAGRRPFLVVATAGTTGAGTIEPVRPMAELARRQSLWLHVDAAWGGFAALVSELRPLLDGIAEADSITFDAHKMLSVPMGAGLLLTRHPRVLSAVCAVDTGYMPRDAVGLDEVVDPYSHSMQWSRRFIGLKLFLTLAVAGWGGYAATIRRQVELGRELEERLAAAGWRIVFPTPLPVVCFVDGSRAEGVETDYLRDVAAAVVASGEAWLSTTELAGKTVLRAAVTSYRTRSEDLDALVGALAEARRMVGEGS